HELRPVPLVIFTFAVLRLAFRHVRFSVEAALRNHKTAGRPEGEPSVTMLIRLMVVADIERLERHVAEQFAGRRVDHHDAKAPRVAAPMRDSEVASEIRTVFGLDLDYLAGTLVGIGQLAAAKLRHGWFAAIPRWT